MIISRLIINITHVVAALALSHPLRISMNGCARHCISASCKSIWRTAMARYIYFWLASMTTGRSLPGGCNQQDTSGRHCWQRSRAGCVTPGAHALTLSVLLTECMRVCFELAAGTILGQCNFPGPSRHWPEYNHGTWCDGCRTLCRRLSCALGSRAPCLKCA